MTGFEMSDKPRSSKRKLILLGNFEVENFSLDAKSKLKTFKLKVFPPKILAL